MRLDLIEGRELGRRIDPRLGQAGRIRVTRERADRRVDVHTPNRALIVHGHRG